MAQDTEKRARPPIAPAHAKPGEPPASDLRWGSFVALSVVAVVLVVFMLEWLHAVLIPIVIGVLLAYALDPFVRILARARIPRAVSAGVVVLVFLAVLGLGAYSLSGQALQIVRQVPEAAQRLRDRVRQRDAANAGALGEVQKAATELQKTAEVASQQTEPKPDAAAGRPVQKVEVVEPAFDAKSYLYWGGMNLLGAAGQFAVIMFLVYFFLVTGDLYKRKILKIAGPERSKKRQTVQILDDINAQISSFIRVQVFTSAVVAVATTAALWFLGVQQYIIWGLLAGLFNSIPYVGPIVVTAAIGVVAFVQFDDLGRTLIVCAATFLITTLEGFLLTPALMSRASRMNPVAIFVGLLFWGYVWGIWGAVLAVPMLMMIKAASDHIEELQPVSELLGE
jgi:predicted PurR-regulated permease PerM